MRAQWLGIYFLLVARQMTAADADTWAASMRRAEALQSEGNLQQAAELLRTWLSRPEAADPAQRAVTWNNLGSVRQQMRDYADAERCYWRAIGTLRDSGRTFVTAVNNLASMYLELGEPGKLRKLGLERIAARLEAEAGGQAPDLARLLENLAEMHFLRRKHQQAEGLYLRALKLWQERGPSAAPQEASAWNRLGLCHYEMGRNADAETEFRNAVEIYSRVGAAHTARLAMAQVNLGAVYARTGRTAEADQLFRTALQTMEKGYGASSPETGEVLANYASALRRMKRHREAAPYQARADAISRGEGGRKIGLSVDVAEFQAK